MFLTIDLVGETSDGVLVETRIPNALHIFCWPRTTGVESGCVVYRFADSMQRNPSRLKRSNGDVRGEEVEGIPLLKERC